MDLGFWDAVVILGAIAAIAAVLKAKYGIYQDNAGNEYHIKAGEQQRLGEEVKQLKERIAVLERITTERETSLEREIEQLRDR